MEHRRQEYRVRWIDTLENTHHCGKYHCTAGLQFYKLGFRCFTACYKNNIFSLLVKCRLVKLEISCTVILPITFSVLWTNI